MTPLDEEYQTRIVSDLNCLARLAAMENARETRSSAAMMAELYRYRRRKEGELVELSAELRAVELCLRLVKPRYGIDCSWDFLSSGVEAILVPRGELLRGVEDRISRRIGREEDFWIRIVTVREEKSCSILVHEGPGEDEPVRMNCPL
jgi:hypothetical protein